MTIAPGPPVAMLFGLNMLLHTPVGDVFTMKEYRGWLKGAGFRSIKQFERDRRYRH
jgi:hypothetical protein